MKYKLLIVGADDELVAIDALVEHVAELGHALVAAEVRAEALGREAALEDGDCRHG